MWRTKSPKLTLIIVIVFTIDKLIYIVQYIYNIVIVTPMYVLGTRFGSL